MPRTQRESRGTQYGNTRGKERQKRKREARATIYRNQQAAEETARHQAELDELMRRQEESPAWGVAEGARIQREIDERHAARMAEIETEQPPEDEIADTFDEAAEIIKKKKWSPKGLRSDNLNDIDQFACTTARLMMKAGYHVEYVMEFTGVGFDEISDFKLDSDGYSMWRFIEPPDDDEANGDTDDA